MGQAWASQLQKGRGSFPWAPPAGPGGAGCCGGCGQPANCCTCCRECRKEAQSLLVEPAQGREVGNIQGAEAFGGYMNQAALDGGLQVKDQSGVATAFVGGDCCVTLSVECAAKVPTQGSMVGVRVADAEGTTLIWTKAQPAGSGYRVYECVVTTKPGATLTALAVNCTARVRWCEIFSC